MGLAEGQVTMRVLLLLLVLWAGLAPVRGSQGRPSWRYISSEVVIPRKELHHGKGIQMPGWLSYSLHFGGKRHVIHMRRKKLFWSRHLLMMTQDDQEALQMDYPFIPPDCYYLGYLEEIPLSMVTVDTCYGGLEGIMKLDDLAYEIKPLSNSQRFEHIVSQIVADTNATGPTYELGHKEVRDPMFSQANASAVPRISSKMYASHHGNVKALALSSNSMYAVFNNVSKCAQFLIRVFSLIDTLFQAVDVSYYISSIIIYDRRDPVNVVGNQYFQHFRYSMYSRLKPHSSIIVIKEWPEDNDIEPAIYSFCSDKNLIMLGYLGRQYLVLSIIAAQKVGRSFGFYYDTVTCTCQRRSTCIMYRPPGLTDSFSNCTFVHLNHVLRGPTADCIFRTDMIYFNKSLTHDRCGNYIVDQGEECDCGSFKQCYRNPCCTSDCTFTTGSKCNTGRCCTNCIYSPAGTLCRPIQTMCDLPEYCRGESLACPDDFYMQDGTPCTEEGYCYHGNCTDRTVHCQEIFGKNAVKGADACYDINKRGDRYGYCTRDARRKKGNACAQDDIQCGRLQCGNVTHLPPLQEHVGFHQSLILGFLCFGLDSHRSTGANDAGHVRPGTPCAPGKFCNNTYCNGIVAQLNYDCLPEKCSYRGICNNNRNCHCHVGWDPPLCIDRGAGGSIDSGSPPSRMRSVRQNDESVIYLRVVFARIYALIAAFLFGFATNVRTIKTVTVKEKIVDEANPEIIPSPLNNK
ncbi:disintegrin and metalloproteinase domain-containing protein 29-like [Ursus maritimus]|uniref:Disintegrin and metalloproteinase domain-containing protein 29-like n=1 Tax=Ursus maritimus TaxID=29073 RepID=A0A384BI06_URSMA|nr:disintegrin and metalloproteinase domain-containing protein 29-like [Ursus maritimus]XP_026347200.2 disintegrin and metalloproteinase domain-containing protein 29-like [Ursus arctos]XP_048072404.1 disintegrin and metalloproteinase domain-containing protein 29-like [Ursus arctos]